MSVTMEKSSLKRYMYIILGNVLITGAYAFLTVPNEIVNGGITSFSMILEKIFSANMTVFVNGITILLLILCLLFLRKDFFIGSIFSSLCYLSLFSFFHSFDTGLFIPPVLCVCIAGIAVGCGYYLCIHAKSTAISFDVIALILHKKNPKINMAYMMGFINILVLLAGLAVYGPVSIMLGILFTGIQTLVLNSLQKLTVYLRNHKHK